MTALANRPNRPMITASLMRMSGISRAAFVLGQRRPWKPRVRIGSPSPCFFLQGPGEGWRPEGVPSQGSFPGDLEGQFQGDDRQDGSGGGPGPTAQGRQGERQCRQGPEGGGEGQLDPVQTGDAPGGVEVPEMEDQGGGEEGAGGGEEPSQGGWEPSRVIHGPSGQEGQAEGDDRLRVFVEDEHAQEGEPAQIVDGWGAEGLEQQQPRQEGQTPPGQPVRSPGRHRYRAGRGGPPNRPAREGRSPGGFLPGPGNTRVPPGPGRSRAGRHRSRSARRGGARPGGDVPGPAAGRGRPGGCRRMPRRGGGPGSREERAHPRFGRPGRAVPPGR